MTMAHLHLLLTHLPVMGVIFGFFLLIYFLFSKKEDIKKLAYIVFVLSGLIMIPTYFTGDKSEEGVEDLPGVSEAVIDKHEDFAKAAAGLTYLLGILALFGIFLKTSDKAKGNVMVSMLVLSFITSGVIAKTANLGGQIRHTEIRGKGFDKNNDSNVEKSENENLNSEKDVLSGENNPEDEKAETKEEK